MPVRHVHSSAVTNAIVSVLDSGVTRRAWNLAWNEAITAREFIEAAGAQLGVTAKLEVDAEATSERCFLNSKWMSALDASEARQHLGFQHEPLERWLPQAFSAWTARL